MLIRLFRNLLKLCVNVSLLQFNSREACRLLCSYTTLVNPIGHWFHHFLNTGIPSAESTYTINYINFRRIRDPINLLSSSACIKFFSPINFRTPPHFFLLFLIFAALKLVNPCTKDILPVYCKTFQSRDT